MAEVEQIEGAEIQRWTYMGRRWNSSQKKIYNLWRDNYGVEKVYDKFRVNIIGGIYLVNVKREGESTVVYPDTARWTGDRDPEATEWVAEDHNADRSREWSLGEKKAAKESDLFDEVVEMLLPHCKSLRQADAFAALIKDRLYGKIR